MNKPITCPNCQKRDIAFVTDIHKCLWGRLLQVFCLIIVVLLLFNYPLGSEQFMITLIIGAIATMLIQSIIAYVESKTHVRCVCKDCGYMWVHKELW